MEDPGPSADHAETPSPVLPVFLRQFPEVLFGWEKA